MPDDILDAAQKKINDAAGLPPEPAPLPPAPSADASILVEQLLETKNPEPVVQASPPPHAPPLLKKKSFKGAVLAILAVLLLTIPVAVYYISQQNQQIADIRNRAADNLYGDGENCSSDAQCQSGNCNPTKGVCWPKQSDGSVCTVNKDCLSGYCEAARCKTPNSFLRGTAILTPKGNLPIETIQPGDTVYAFNSVSNAITAEVVEKTITYTVDHYFRLELDDGTTLRVTGRHPLYRGKDYQSSFPDALTGNPQYPGFEAVSHLAVGDTLYRFAKNNSLTQTVITGITIIPETAQVYNLQVSGARTYFAENIAVHNKYFPPPTLYTLPNGSYCEYDNWCVSKVCNPTTKKCSPPLTDGSECGGKHERCASGYCNPTNGYCWPKSGENGSCITDSSCADGYKCQSGTCKKLSDGSECNGNHAICASGYCNPTNGYCWPKSGQGGTCVTNSSCADGFECKSGKCELQQGDNSSCGRNTDRNAPICCPSNLDCTGTVGTKVCEPPNRLECKLPNGDHCTIEANGCNDGGGGGGGEDTQDIPTPTNTVPPEIPVCQNVKIYKDGAQVTPSALRAGDAVLLAVKGTLSPAKARFRINGGDWTETTTQNSGGEWTLEYTIPSGIIDFVIEAEVFTNGAWR